MSKRMTIILYATACLAGPAIAEEFNCKSEILATGKGALTKAAAEEKAVATWRAQAVSNYGIFFGEFSVANEGKKGAVERCTRSLVGLHVCQARGRPCELVTTGAAEIKCKLDDGDDCQPTIKWVQSRLNAKGSNISVDGIFGFRTERAILTYRRAYHLGDSVLIDGKLIDSLKS